LSASLDEMLGSDGRDILVVQDFVDVLPGDVSGLPPVREVEFSINVMPDTSVELFR
jgi:hypothetical protein